MIHFLIFMIILFSLSCSKQNNENIILSNEIDLLSEFYNAEIKSPTTSFVTQDFKSITLNQNTRWSIYSHPNSQIKYSTNIELSDPFTLSFYIGIDELAWMETKEYKSDGVDFIIKDQNEKILYKRYLNPLNNENDRGWVKEDIQIDATKSNPIRELIFETNTGNNTYSDWAYWAEPKIEIIPKNESFIKNDKTNIILITIDTLRKDYLNCYNNSYIQTTNINELAENGILFENAYSSSSTTSPSHTSIFTSLNPYVHGVIGNDYHLGNKIPTLTKILKENNYKTGAAVSAYHLNPNRCGLNHYFDYYAHPKDTTESYRWKLINSGYSTVSSGIKFLDQNHNEPLFLWLHLYDPHMPYIPVADYDRMYYKGNPFNTNLNSMKNVFYDRNFKFENENWMHGITDIDYFKKQYAAEITYVDDQIGRVLECLKRLKIDKNTMIVITADHGESLSEHDIYFNHWGLYEVEIGVPLIIYHPNIKPKQKRIDKRVSIIDIAPTIIELIGDKDNFTAKNMFDGVSLIKTWEKDEPISRKNILSNSLYYIQTASIGERYKVNWIIRDATYNDEHLAVQKDQVTVFDLIDDPAEEKSVAKFLWISKPSKPVTFSASDSFHDKLMKIRDEAKQKTVPTYSEWKTLFENRNENTFIVDELKNDEPFYFEIQYGMQQMIDELNVDLNEKLKNEIDLAGLKEIDKESINIFDEKYKDQLESLGYTSNH